MGERSRRRGAYGNFYTDRPMSNIARLRGLNPNENLEKDVIEKLAPAYLDSEMIGHDNETLICATDKQKLAFKKAWTSYFSHEKANREKYTARETSPYLVERNHENNLMRERTNHDLDCVPAIPPTATWPTTKTFFHSSMGDTTRSVLTTTDKYAAVAKSFELLDSEASKTRMWSYEQFENWLQTHVDLLASPVSEVRGSLQLLSYPMDLGRRVFLLIVLPILDGGKFDRRCAYMFYSCKCKYKLETEEDAQTDELANMPGVRRFSEDESEEKESEPEAPQKTWN